MSIYSTFFLCQPNKLPSGFPGWKSPLPEPVQREVRNPFTGETMVISSRRPEWADEEEESWDELPDVRIVHGQGDYNAYLEGRLPAFVANTPHVALKRLTNIEIEALAEAADVPTELESPLYAPPTKSDVLFELPADLVKQLVDGNLNEIAESWAEVMSSPEHTHSVAGERIDDGWTTEQALELVELLAELARRATPEQRVYFLIEG